MRRIVGGGERGSYADLDRRPRILSRPNLHPLLRRRLGRRGIRMARRARDETGRGVRAETTSMTARCWPLTELTRSSTVPIAIHFNDAGFGSAIVLSIVPLVGHSIPRVLSPSPSPVPVGSHSRRSLGSALSSSHLATFLSVCSAYVSWPAHHLLPSTRPSASLLRPPKPHSSPASPSL